MAERSENGIVAAYRFDVEGHPAAIGPEAFAAPPTVGFDWIHARHRDTDIATWLVAESGLAVDHLAPFAGGHDRPRCELDETGTALIVLRGVTLLRGALPEQMTPLVLDVTARRVVTVDQEPVAAVRDVVASLARGHLFRTPGELVTELAGRLIDRMDIVIGDLSDRADDLEEGVWAPELPDRFATRVAELRRLSLSLRRTLTPQREALNRLSLEDPVWLSPRDRGRLREAADRVTRMADELDSIRERVAVVHDQLLDRRAEKLNRTMLVLAMVTTLFAPLSLISGLFGMNVPGVPFAENASGFAMVGLVCALVAGATFVLFRRAGWL